MKIRRLLVAAGTVLAATCTVPVTAALAAPTIGNGVCGSGDYCTYRDLSYGGSVFDTSGSVNRYSDWWYFNTGFSPNDRTSSVWNRGGSVLRVYQNVGYSGNVDCFNAGVATSNVGTYGGSLGDNSASSHLVGGSNC